MDPDGGNTLGDRLSAALVSALFGVPLVGAWWLWLNYATSGTDVHFPIRTALYALGGLALFGFVFPRLSASLYGLLWRIVGEGSRGIH
jgi:hypothetical protein